MTSACLTCLGAIEITTQFYPANKIPKEFDKFPDGGDITVLFLDGWPEDSIITLTEKGLAGETKKRGSFKIEKGVRPVQIISSVGYMPGIPVTFTFSEVDKGIKEKITLIPNRLMVKSTHDDAFIEVKLVEPNPANYRITFEGFKKDEEITFRSTSYDEKLESKYQISDNFAYLYMPGVVNKLGGIARLSFTRMNGEDLKLEVPWGMEWLKYIQYYDKDGKAKPFIESPDFRKDFPDAAQYFDSKR